MKNNQTTISQTLFSNRALVSLAVPIVIDSLLAIAAGIVDSAMVSSAGEAAVSAISLVDSLNLMFILIFNAVTTGGVVVTSQYIGSRNIERAKCSANQLLYGSTSMATFLMLVLIFLIPQSISLVYGSLDADVFENAKIYFFWTLLGYPFFAIGSSCTALLRAQAKSSLALWITGAVNILNVIGNAILIYGFKLGVAGAAISTTFARVVWATFGLLILHNKELTVHFENLLKFRLDFDILLFADGCDRIEFLGRIGVAIALGNLKTACLGMIEDRDEFILCHRLKGGGSEACQINLGVIEEDQLCCDR